MLLLDQHAANWMQKCIATTDSILKTAWFRLLGEVPLPEQAHFQAQSHDSDVNSLWMGVAIDRVLGCGLQRNVGLALDAHAANLRLSVVALEQMAKSGVALEVACPANLQRILVALRVERWRLRVEAVRRPSAKPHGECLPHDAVDQRPFLPAPFDPGLSLPSFQVESLQSEV